jgi:hypothetical protein
MRKLLRALVPAAALAGALAFAGTASAAVTGGNNWGGNQQMCPQGNNQQGNSKDDQGRDGCGCEGQYSWGQQKDWSKGCEQCKTVSEWVKETVRVRTWWGWKTETKWVCKDVQACTPYNPGPPQQGGGCGCQNGGGGNQGGWGSKGGDPSCSPVTVNVTSEGGAVITEVSDVTLTSGEEVAYGSTDYWVTDVKSHAGTTTFELSTTNPQDSTTVWTTNGGSEGSPLPWSLTTVCATS